MAVGAGPRSIFQLARGDLVNCGKQAGYSQETPSMHMLLIHVSFDESKLFSLLYICHVNIPVKQRVEIH